MNQATSGKPPTAIFLVLCVAALATVGGYVVWTRGANPASEAATEVVTDPEALAAVRARPHALFRNTSPGQTYGRVTLARLDQPEGPRHPTGLTCDRVHFAAGRGVCLTADRGVVTTYTAVTFDEGLAAHHEIALPGVPSRVQVAPDGRRAGLTVFVSGDSYASGGFSTRTLIVDLADGRVLGNLEDYVATRDGHPFKAVDFNYWGVTFVDSSRFYATLGTGGHRYLVEGDVDRKVVRTIRDGVECPSLSPDGSRVVFKKRITMGVRLTWRLAVLELATMRETALAETKSVDDQAEWLDDGHVVYGLPSDTRPGSSDVWVVSADGSGPPRVLFPYAWSPAVVRPETR